MQFVFTKYADKQFEKLSTPIQEQLIAKLQLLKSVQLFKKNIKPVVDLNPATHRLRIGNYRLLLSCDFTTNKTIILKVGHRRDIYR